MTRIPDARYVKEQLRLTRGVGAMAVMARMQEWLNEVNPGNYTFLRLEAADEYGWQVEIIWAASDGEITEYHDQRRHPWTALYSVCAAYIRDWERRSNQ